MRILPGGLAIVLLAATCALSQDLPKTTGTPPPTPLAIQDDLSYFENVWGLKKLSFSAERFRAQDVKLIDGKILPQGRITYMLEFQRDIRNYDLAALQRVLVFPDGKLRHVFFDADNIAINSLVPIGSLIQGDVSGVQGDVLRITVDFGQDLEIMTVDPRGINQAKKVAARRS